MAAHRYRAGDGSGADPSPAPVLGQAAGLVVLLLVAALIVSPSTLMVRVSTEPPPVPQTEPGELAERGEAPSGQAAPPRPVPVPVEVEEAPDVVGEVTSVVQDLLRVRDAAVATGSGAEADWLLTQGTQGDPTGASAFAVLSSLPVTGFESSLVDGSLAALPVEGAPAEVRNGDAEQWQGRVETSYRLGEGPVTVRTDTVVLDRDAGSWQLRSWTPFPGAGEIGTVAPWDLGPVQVVQGERVLVLSWVDGDTAADVERARSWGTRVADWADAGATEVDSYLGTGWPPVTLVLAPATRQQYADLVPGPAPASQDVYAAVTTDVATPDGPGDVVVLNPSVRDQLVEDTWQVTITHELVHVASGALYGDRQEIWLAEGVADLVGWSRLVPGTFDQEVVAARLLERVADGRVVPEQLPDVADFADADADVVGDAYEGSWLAAVLLQDELGTDGLFALYADASSGDGSAAERTDAALRRVTGEGRTAFQVRWADHVRSLATP